ncbi:unnamed protein product [Cylindrotheca closterium]|uniref:Methyltransferase type 11 domain-containing protein n=1 Tax=Cylindrotheca closterium TaxID=2856 RepID=A0AAD2G3B9_9STRA|nr:unnamed protein product [Cylindrotheca closterium]
MMEHRQRPANNNKQGPKGGRVLRMNGARLLAIISFVAGIFMTSIVFFARTIILSNDDSLNEDHFRSMKNIKSKDDCNCQESDHYKEQQEQMAVQKQLLEDLKEEINRLSNQLTGSHQPVKEEVVVAAAAAAKEAAVRHLDASSSNLVQYKTELAGMLMNMWDLAEDKQMINDHSGETSVQRLMLNTFMHEVSDQLPGTLAGMRCMIFEFKYISQFGGCRETFHFRHDPNEKGIINPMTTKYGTYGIIKGDLEGDVSHVPQEYFDMAIYTQQMQHEKHFWKALPNLAGTIDEGGLLIFSIPWAFMFHPLRGDFYRYSPSAVYHLLESSGFAICHIVSDGWKSMQMHALGLGVEDIYDLESVLKSQSKVSLLSGATSYMAVAQRVEEIGDPCTLQRLKLSNEITREEINGFGIHGEFLPDPMKDFPYGPKKKKTMKVPNKRAKKDAKKKSFKIVINDPPASEDEDEDGSISSYDDGVPEEQFQYQYQYAIPVKTPPPTRGNFSVEFTEVVSDYSGPIPPKTTCFVTASYAKTLQSMDNMIHVRNTSPYFKFFMFTNWNDDQWKTPGWIKITTKYNYTRSITHSRYGKFLGWKYDQIRQECDAVYYMDSNIQLKANQSTWMEMSATISSTEPGIMQFKHEQNRSGIFDEFAAITKWKKDYAGNVQKSIAWFSAQPDFENDIPIYMNQLFGYNPKSPTYQRLSQGFWDHYSKEEDSWRDQPLWAFMLHRYNVTPLAFPETNFKRIWKVPNRVNFGHHDHRYTSEADVIVDWD